MKKILLVFVLCIGYAASTLYADTLEFKCVAEKAIKEKKLLLVSVVNENCYYCNKMDEDVFSSKRVMKKLDKHYARIKLVAGSEIIPKFLKVDAYPTNFILDPKTFNILDEYVGYLAPKDFLEVTDMVYKLEVSHKNIENE